MGSKNEKIKLSDEKKIILMSIGLFVLVWVLDSLLDSLVFHESTVIGQIISPTVQEITVRLLFGSIFILFGIYIQFGVTRLKRAEDAQNEAVRNLEGAIRKAEDEKNKTSAIIEAIGDGIILQDTDYKIVYQNQIQNKIYGNRIGEYCYKAYEGKDSICEDCPIELSFKDGKIHKAERKIPTDKGILYYELTGSPLRDYTGNIIGGVKVVRDLTGSKQADIEKDRFLKAFASSTDGITIADEKDRFIYVNEAYAAFFGYNQDELIGNTWHKITPPEMISPTEEGLSNTMHNKDIGIFSGDVPGLRKDGTIIPTEVRGKGIWDEYGNYQGHICIVRDITERKRMEEELQKSIHQQTAILNNIPDIAWLKDKEGRFIAVNKPFAEVCGLSPEDLVDKTDLDIWHKDLAEGYMADDREVMETGRRKQVEEPLIDKDGIKTWIETIKTPIYDDRGKVIGTTGIARDVTERKQIEEALHTARDELEMRVQERTAELIKTNETLQAEITERKNAEEKYHKLIDNIQDGVFIIQDGKIQFANEAFARVAGYNVKEVTGKDYTELVAPEDLEMVSDRYRSKAGRGEYPS